MLRRRFIERINTDTYKLDFFLLEGIVTVEFTDKIDPDGGCGYHFSTSNKDWIDAIKLVNSIKAQMEKEEHERAGQKVREDHG